MIMGVCVSLLIYKIFVTLLEPFDAIAFPAL